jgi:large subunit ribosomal protein L25
MQKTVPMLQSQMRNDRGSRKARKLRDTGQIPVVVYGHGEAPVSIAVNLHQLSEALHHGNRIFEAELNGTKQTLLVKDLQYDYLGRKVIHADMVRVDLTETVQVSVPVETRGTPKTGIIDVLLGSLQVECVVTSIPEKISITVREMNIGDMVKAQQIQLPDGVKLVTDAEALVLLCHEVAEMKTTEELEQEMPAGPEVITERVREEEGQEPTAEASKEKEKEKSKEKEKE